MSGIGQWQPAQGAHAIQMAAIGINFREGITGHLLDGIAEKVAPLAAELGLADRNPIQELGLVLGPNGPQPQAQSAGCEFLRRERPDFFSDKLSLGKAMIRYEDWSYTRWAVTAEKIEVLVAPVLETYTAATLIADIYVEYIDVFLAPTDSSDSVYFVIREDSPFVARGAASATGFWHTHSGFFSPDGDPVRRLHQINIDVANVNATDGERRAIQIRTFVSDQANRPDRPASSELTQAWASVASRLQDIHDCAKDDFRAILTAEAASAVSLG